jgi:hypothetical protein
MLFRLVVASAQDEARLKDFLVNLPIDPMARTPRSIIYFRCSNEADMRDFVCGNPMAHVVRPIQALSNEPQVILTTQENSIGATWVIESLTEGLRLARRFGGPLLGRVTRPKSGRWPAGPLR